MIPEQLKNMFGLNTKQDLNMANNIWKMLDQMAQSSPDNYKNFIQKNIKEGVQDVKHKKQQKDKPFKTKPEKGFRLQFDASLQQKSLQLSENKLEEKFDLIKQKWENIKSKFKSKVRIALNICFSERIKLPLSQQKQELKDIKIQTIKLMQVFYHSLNGPQQINNGKQLHYIMVINKNAYDSLMKQPNGKKMIMSLTISYFQQRFQNDRNPLLALYNPQLYKKISFYEIQKQSISISNKCYLFGDNQKVQDILLQIDSDIKRSKEILQQQQKIKKKYINDQKKQKIIKFKQQQTSLDNKKYIQEQFSLNKADNTKRPLIEVLSQKLNQNQLQTKLEQTISYSLIEKQNEVSIQFLVPGIKIISELNLAIGGKCIKLNYVDLSRSCQIQLSKQIREDSIVAKLKKKIGKLLLTVTF